VCSSDLGLAIQLGDTTGSESDEYDEEFGDPNDHIFNQPTVEGTTAQILRQWEAELLQDPFCRAMIEYLRGGVLPSEDHSEPNIREKILKTSMLYDYRDGLLFCYPVEPTSGKKVALAKACLVPPKAFQRSIIDDCHTIGGHFALKKTLLKIRRRYWWTGMIPDIRMAIDRCTQCRLKNPGSRGQLGPRMEMPYPQNPFELISMDFVGPMAETARGNRYLLVIVDHCTRWADAYALPNMYAEWIAKVLVENYYKYNGVPDLILTDQGANFMSKLLRELHQILQVKILRTTAYKPSTNGKTERLNGILVRCLAKMCEDRVQDWDKFLPHILYSYNTTPQRIVDETPFFMLKGYDPKPIFLPGDIADEEEVITNPSQYVKRLTERLRISRGWGLEAWKRTGAIDKEKADEKSKPCTHRIGSRVLLKTMRFPSCEDA
jgi:hypothetical protein